MREIVTFAYGVMWRVIQIAFCAALLVVICLKERDPQLLYLAVIGIAVAGLAADSAERGPR